MSSSYFQELADRLQRATTTGRIKESHERLCAWALEAVGVLRTLATCDDEPGELPAVSVEAGRRIWVVSECLGLHASHIRAAYTSPVEAAEACRFGHHTITPTLLDKPKKDVPPPPSASYRP